ncbi:gamma-glutamyl hydrolase [Ambystoma mexicanum]|uniref:gamma-glutamyl hydrolase n=1 Tax=Ambystoma mexicanum TaxID=8296 RepID=UPI0037E798DD
MQCRVVSVVAAVPRLSLAQITETSRRASGKMTIIGAAVPGSMLLLFLGGVLLLCDSAVSLSHGHVNDRPIIGILAQETHFGHLLHYGSSYIAASYVKTLESVGARAMPIRINLTEAEYEHIFNSINGVLFPGGGVDLKTSEYARAANIFYNLALKANDRGDYFPIWGTCLGFEQLTYITSGENVLTITKTEDVALPLNFTTAPEKSRIFRDCPKDVLKALASKPITANFHDWSLSLQNYTSNEKLKNFYKVVSTNTDGHLEFVSTMEAYKYPIYGVQWHPEKNPYEWKTPSSTSHSLQAIKAAFHMAYFFVNEGAARPQDEEWKNRSEETRRMQNSRYRWMESTNGHA